MYKKPASDNERDANALIDIKIFEFTTSFSRALDNEIDVWLCQTDIANPTTFRLISNPVKPIEQPNEKSILDKAHKTSALISLCF